MGVLYFIRHGETVWNTEGRYQGQTDTQLSPTGDHQAQQVAHRLSSDLIQRIYSSDLERAYKTAVAIAQPHRLRVITDARLREYCFGEWEGLKRSEIRQKFPVLFKKRYEDTGNTRIPGGELPSEVQERVMEFVHSVVRQWPTGNMAIVSHGGVLRMLLATILQMDISQAFRFKMGNTGVSRLKYTVDPSHINWEATTINDTQHLAD